MRYQVLIEGLDGARLVRRGALPRRGDWLQVDLRGVCWWLPVIEVTHFFARGVKLARVEKGCDWAHAMAETVVYTSLAVGVEAKVRSTDDTFKYVLPPSRWPFGGVDPSEVTEDDLSDEEASSASRRRRRNGRCF